ncbi:hydrogenase iron-sulfur subunit [Ramlibacter sp. USB13]|uniref:Hydrogenase iron-sulfur subunit n=1 Tax=Ramlibacter cellulosilyticus TaxID=2764187 RepID=A0A923MV72_9BURK|nr:hydrogenase iron-sulfur subunit [Ramlibacter cellulosilyticus]MBC5785641.1 hydrogenase iron-sulfur subunit [Ramlibacter cellulosilyticus]
MRAWLLALDHRFDAAFGGAANPLKQLGALAFLLLWLLAVSGVVLYALLDTSAQGSYRSMEALSRTPWGQALRGLHRYAADAFVLAMLLHLLREGVLRHHAGVRTHAWTTGVLLLPLAYASSIGGFWIPWDRLGQFSAIATAEWLDALPFLGAPLARNFLQGGVGDRLFSLFVFVHLGLPLLLVFASWTHVQRISRVRAFPHRTLAAGTSAALLLLAFVLPVGNQGPADLALAPQRLDFDWLLLFVHPLVDATSAQATWALLAAVFAGLLALPLVRVPAQPVAVVDPANCNGCGRCADDCPFAAITLVPHPLRRPGVQLAQVNTALCASCGICAGACPSSTPFRKTQAFVTGIDMPQGPMGAMRERLREGLARGARRVVFGCERGARVATLRAPDVIALGLPCIANLPPSFVEYALREGADSVVVAGCREGGCEFRLGQQWMAQRLAGMREPHLRAGVPPRWRTVWADAGEEARLRAALEDGT